MIGTYSVGFIVILMIGTVTLAVAAQSQVVRGNTDGLVVQDDVTVQSTSRKKPSAKQASRKQSSRKQASRKSESKEV